jgi:hypothetical protein
MVAKFPPSPDRRRKRETTGEAAQDQIIGRRRVHQHQECSGYGVVGDAKGRSATIPQPSELAVGAGPGLPATQSPQYSTGYVKLPDLAAQPFADGIARASVDLHTLSSLLMRNTPSKLGANSPAPNFPISWTNSADSSQPRPSDTPPKGA